MADENFDLNNLTPEQQKLLDIGFAKGASKADASVTQLKELETKYSEASRKLASVEETAKLTKEDRDKYLQQVREYEEKNLTTDQRWEKRLSEERASMETIAGAAKKEAETWRNKHNELIIQSALVNVATELDAIVPNQVVALLRPAIELQLEDGDTENPRYLPKVKSKDPKTGAAVLLDLGEGVKQFLDQNPNLVRSNVTMRRDGKLETIVGADGTTVFTEDQLGDPKFVNEHWNEIQTAMKHGRMKVR